MKYVHIDTVNVNNNGNPIVLGFYDEVFNGIENIPSPNIQITDEYWQTLLTFEILEVVNNIVVQYVPTSTEAFSALVLLKTSEAITLFEDNVKIITGDTNILESSSWAAQETEARNYVVNNTIATPLLSTLLVARNVTGETILSLANTIITKADTYKDAYGTVLGTYHNNVTQIENATTVAELNAIVI